MNETFLILIAVMSMFALMFGISKLKDMRGEVDPEGDEDESGEGGEAPEEESQDDSSVDESILEELDDVELEGFDEVEDGSEKEEEESEDTPSGEDETKEDTESLKRELERLRKHTKDLNIALHKERQAKKQLTQKGDEEAPLTDAQIVGLLEAHEGDAATQLQIMKYVAQQSQKKGTEEAVNQAEVSRMKKEIDSLILDSFPDLAKEDSELRVGVNTTKDNLFLDDHPLGDFLAVAAMVYNDLDNIRNEAYELGKKEALGDKVETKRKEKAKATKLAPKGSRKTGIQTGLPDQFRNTAKQLGLNKQQEKIYAKLLKGSGAAVEVQ